MNNEKLIDSFEFIDESMLLSVDKLRNKPKRSIIIPITIAACFAVIAFGAFAFSEIGGMFIFPDESHIDDKNTDGLCNNGNSDSVMDHVDSVIPTIPGAVGGIDGAATDDPLYGISTPITDEMPSVILKVKKWNDNGFRAEVYQNVDTDVLSVGEIVDVVFEEDFYVGTPMSDGSVKFEFRQPTQSDLPPEAVVTVQFSNVDTTSQQTILTVCQVILN